MILSTSVAVNPPATGLDTKGKKRGSAVAGWAATVTGTKIVGRPSRGANPGTKAPGGEAPPIAGGRAEVAKGKRRPVTRIWSPRISGGDSKPRVPASAMISSTEGVLTAGVKSIVYRPSASTPIAPTGSPPL